MAWTNDVDIGVPATKVIRIESASVDPSDVQVRFGSAYQLESANHIDAPNRLAREVWSRLWRPIANSTFKIGHNEQVVAGQVESQVPVGLIWREHITGRLIAVLDEYEP